MRRIGWVIYVVMAIVFSANAVSAELDEINKIRAEDTDLVIAEHPACTEIYRQEELNPGDNALLCSNFEFEVADKELNATYKLVRSRLSADRKTILKKEQISWVKEKEKSCEEETRAAMTPRFRDAANNFCLADLTRKRTVYLKSFR